MNCLITKIGKRIDCVGDIHHRICQQRLRIGLQTFLSSGGVRVKIHHNTMAVEFYKSLTDKQNKIINKLLKQQPIYIIITESGCIEKLRPIRSFDFGHSLVPK